jgi:hypothetical protein
MSMLHPSASNVVPFVFVVMSPWLVIAFSALFFASIFWSFVWVTDSNDSSYQCLISYLIPMYET